MDKYLSYFKKEAERGKSKRFLRRYSVKQADEIQGAMALVSEKIRVVSYNVLSDRRDMKLPKIHHWHNRIGRLAAQIIAIKPDILCIQELYGDQVHAFHSRLGKGYDFYSLASDPDINCKNKELSGIFFRKSRFALLDGKVIPLNDRQRTCGGGLTQVLLRDKKTGNKVAVFNAHLPFFCVNDRMTQAECISKITKNFLKANRDTGIIVTGDMNTFPNRPDLRLPARDGENIERTIRKGAFLCNAKYIAKLGYLGGLSTYTNDEKKRVVRPFTGTGTPGVFLDHIYVSKKCKPLIFATDQAKVGGHYPSDHFPVIADLVIRD